MINYQATGEALTKGKIPVKLFPSSAAIFQAMARDMADTIKEHNAKGLATTFILPVGPVGQYPYFVDLVNQERISLKQCHFLNMDEYLTDSQEWIPASDPLSFRGAMRRDVFEKIDEELRIPASQWVFPDPKDLGKVQRTIDKLGGVDVTYGGIGINGHVAFNEAEEHTSATVFAKRETRIVTMTPETRVANAIGSLGGAIDQMPRYAVTIGMRQILASKRIVLGVFRTWHRAVLREAIFGPVSAAFPVTLLQRHPDSVIMANDVAAERPF
ncbi:MAG: glucosamine-6-phosphate isomerase [Sphaerochaetaceae bacterium]|jgi:glucosamine-6-phosphate deaminase|nr:glucosamine-6-phosphate isomerase [Sphaerochaetaceae bacterium]